MPAAANGSTAVTGGNGYAQYSNTLISRITKWSINPVDNGSAWGDSDSDGYTNRSSGRKDCTGTLEGKLDSAAKFHGQLREGDFIQLTLWEDGLDATPGDPWQFPRAKIEGIQLEFNNDTKEVVGWTANFASDGKYWAPGESQAPAVSFGT